MKRIDARFDEPPRASHKAWTMVAMLAMLAVGAITWAWLERTELAAKKAHLDALTRLQHETADAHARRPTIVPFYDASARQMLKERQMPWPAALTAIENVAMVGVTATAIEFATGDGTVQLEVAFAEHAKLLEYVDALNAGLESSAQGWRWAIRQTQTNTAPNSASLSGSATLMAIWR